jgi:hypothetical protein
MNSLMKQTRKVYLAGTTVGNSSFILAAACMSNEGDTIRLFHFRESALNNGLACHFYI